MAADAVQKLKFTLEKQRVALVEANQKSVHIDEILSVLANENRLEISCRTHNANEIMSKEIRKRVVLAGCEKVKEELLAELQGILLAVSQSATENAEPSEPGQVADPMPAVGLIPQFHAMTPAKAVVEDVDF